MKAYKLCWVMLQEKHSAGSLSQGEFIQDFKISSVVQE